MNISELQEKYKKGQIKDNQLSDNEYEALVMLYIKQNQNLNSKLEKEKNIIFDKLMKLRG